MSDIDSQNLASLLNAEVAKRLRREQRLSHDERMERHERLQKVAWETLMGNATSLAEFHRRNHRKRSSSNVNQLEKKLRLEFENILVGDSNER